MTDGSNDNWVYSGRGVQPTLRWSFTTDAPLVDVSLARESGETLAADESGLLYFLDRQGLIQAQSRTRHQFQRVALADDGSAGVVSFDNTMVGWIDRRLQFSWTREMPDEVVSIAIDPFGTHVAVAMVDGVNMVFNSTNGRYSRFESVRPLRHLSFLATSPNLMGAAEHGLIARYNLTGSVIWSEKLWSNVGDMAVTGDGRHVFLASFTHGAQLFDGEAGVSRGTFVTEGTVGLVACGFSKRHLVAASLERQLYAINEGGDLIWHLSPNEDLTRVIMLPLCDGIVCGFSSGRLLRLDYR